MVLRKSDILAGLRQLGINSGTMVFVHASIRSFGAIEGGAQTVVTAMLDLLGPQGTLVVPIFHDFFLKGPDQVWDRERNPSKMGVFSEMVRTWPGSLRSGSPIASYCRNWTAIS